MIRTLAAATITILAATIVLAQSDPIEERRAIMKQNGQNLRGVLNDMQEGKIPYEQAKVDEAFNQLMEAAARFPKLFPESSKTGGKPNRFSASPRIWENMSDFEAKDAAYAKAVAEQHGKVKDIPTLKAAYQPIDDACAACHQDYRVRNR